MRTLGNFATTYLRLAAIMLALLPWLTIIGPPALADEAPAAGPAAVATSVAVQEEEPAELDIANRTIFTMRSAAYGVPPQERARNVAENIRLLVEQGGPLQVTTQPVAEGVAVLVDGRLAFRVLNGDVNLETGESPLTVATVAAQRLERAIGEMREVRDGRALLVATGHALLATLALIVLLWLLLRGYRALARRMHAVAQRRMERLLPSWTGQVLGEAGLTGLFTLPLRVLGALLAVLFVYEWAGFVLRRFPYTRPWGEALLANLLGAVGSIGEAALAAVPDLLFVLLIFLAARMVVRAVRAFFHGVQEGRIQVGAIDETTARPTGQLVVTGVWILAMVAAYPYIPGSGSEAFKGIGVFVGLMLSIGSSGVVNQAVSGLMLMYTRALRPGEYVQIGDTEGTVRSVGFLTTRIETLRREEVNIPNALITSSVTRNFSRLAAGVGVWVATKVTIGYDTPWRQVKSLLELAAQRTGGVLKDPAPRVRQTGLQDFYVEYTLLVCLPDPAKRVVALDELHGNIQDAFNEFGVQIMSPNYEADPEAPKVVPKDRWFEPPATG